MGYQDINTGEMLTAGGDAVLRTIAIGSCIAIIFYDRARCCGGMAHAMLPGWAPAGAPRKYCYIQDAAKSLIDEFYSAGSKTADISCCLIGAGNVLQKDDDAVCTANIKSAVKAIGEMGVRLEAFFLGGSDRKGAALDVSRALVSFTAAGGKERLLWSADSHSRISERVRL